MKSLSLRAAKIFALLSTVFLSLASCSSTDISQQKPFANFVGKPVKLYRPMLVTRQTGGFPDHNDLKDPETTHKPPAPMRVVDPKNDRTIAYLPAGHPVVIDRVKDNILGDSEEITAYGRTLLNDGSETRFVYIWGFTWVLEPAPWEPNAVPARRYPPFRVSPHFDYPQIFDLGGPGKPTWDSPSPVDAKRK